MSAAGLQMPASAIAHDASTRPSAAVGELGLPCIVRPAYTLGGRGGGIARDARASSARIVARGLAASPISQVLLDQSVLGWGEFELEVMRDHNDNVVIVCSIENLDPMGVHTGDSRHRRAAADAHRRASTRSSATRRSPSSARVGVETGGSNVQFAVNPETDEIVVIEMNPRVSRSSALASQGDGLPDREDRRAARRRLRARGDPQRHHPADARRASSRRSTTSSSSGRGSRSRSSPAPTASCPPT